MVTDSAFDPGAAEISVRVPGRVNIIGDHTDYTGGLVLPTVVDLHTMITGSTAPEPVWTLTSQTHGPAVIPLDLERADTVEPAWARYPAGVLIELRSLGVPIVGFTGTVSTSLPVGAGLSSSAALEVATARIVMDVANRSGHDLLDDVEIARACQRAEHMATGVPCGIMDQLSIVAGSPGWATLIDCNSLDIVRIPIPASVQIEHRFISGRTLVGSEYADRVAQCREIENLIGPLREASTRDLARLDSDLLLRRARHVVTENRRVLDFVDALHTGDLERAGRLMTESHRSLAVDYETSTPEMDAAVESALGEPRVLGARMTGGGFGGCIVILRHI